MTYLFTLNKKYICVGGDETKKDSFSDNKISELVQDAGSIKTIFKKEKNSIQASYSLFRTKTTCDTIPSENGAYMVSKIKHISGRTYCSPCENYNFEKPMGYKGNWDSVIICTPDSFAPK